MPKETSNEENQNTLIPLMLSQLHPRLVQTTLGFINCIKSLQNQLRMKTASELTSVNVLHEKAS